MSITIYMVEGCAAGRAGLVNVALPVEAIDSEAAELLALSVLQQRRLSAVKIRAHRCKKFERQLDQWVRAVFVEAWGK